MQFVEEKLHDASTLTNQWDAYAPHVILLIIRMDLPAEDPVEGFSDLDVTAIRLLVESRSPDLSDESWSCPIAVPPIIQFIRQVRQTPTRWAQANRAPMQIPVGELWRRSGSQAMSHIGPLPNVSRCMQQVATCLDLSSGVGTLLCGALFHRYLTGV